MMPNELVDFWQCEFAAPFFAHPADLPILRQEGDRFIDVDSVDFDSLISVRRFCPFDDRLHLSLMPGPYLGDLSCAEFVILQINPGLAYTDYWAESKVPEFRVRLKDNLRQSFNGIEFPFPFLDPQFCWTGGFTWWEKKLRGVLTLIADRKFDGSYFEALRDLSRKLASVELVPYHSRTFGAQKLITKLPSVKMVKKFVHERLVPDAKAGKLTLIVMKKGSFWGLPMGQKGIVVYPPRQAQASSLGPESPGGRAILERYCIG
ncbi:MAG: hypothetical protein ABSE27_11780 [Acidobacteriaceae bacterium]|jgi:hypothetical protein